MQTAYAGGAGTIVSDARGQLGAVGYAGKAAGAAARAYQGDPRYLNQGLVLKQSLSDPTQRFVSETSMPGDGSQYSQLGAALPGPPPGSSAPYYLSSMVSNPSLWPDEAQGNSLFRDQRAFQPMDVLSIVITESLQGDRKTDTTSQAQSSIVYAIKNLLGFATSWENQNPGLDSSNLINASSDSNFKGKGETKREGYLKSRISAVVLEVLPNGLLRIEGTKIVSIDHEEEIMVISGLARSKDVDATNSIDSSKIANMRVDVYGRGVVGESTSPGWLTRALRYAWPF